MSEFSAPTLLTADHDLTGFDCGKPPLNHFLQTHALNNQRAMISRTYVVVDSIAAVVGYYTLALLSVETSDAPPNLVRGMPQYPVPCMLMGRFAVALSAQGRGLGRSLFVDALGRSWRLMKDGPAPARLFVVDAKDDSAKSFYERFNMVPSPLDPMRLFLSYKTIRDIFEPP